MPSRKHYLVRQDRRMLFDHRAYYHLRGRVGPRIESTTLRRRFNALPLSFRKGFDELAALAREVGMSDVVQVIRLPRNLSRKRNPIVRARQIWG
jgi:hypothetical protein